MTTRSNHFSEIVLTPLFILFICAMVEESGQILSKPSTKECLRKCAFARKERSTTKVSRFIPCYRKCLNWNVEDQHALSAKNTFKQRTRKALATNPDCRDSSPGHFEEWTPSKVNVSFGQYENTSCWYVNVSWTPINDTEGNWTGILVRLTIQTTDWFATPINCFVQPTNQTFLKINISSYHYHYPDHISVNIIALPYSSDISAPLKIFVPNIATFPPSTATTATITTTPHISRCHNEYGDLVWYPAKVNADFVQGNNKDWYANISWTPLTDPTVTWTGYLLTVFVGDLLTSVGVSKAVQCFKLAKNRTYIIVDSSHGWKYPESISINVTAYPRPRFEIADMMYFYPIQYTTSILTEGLSEPATSASLNPQTKTRDVVIIVFLSVGGVAVALVIAVVVFLRWRKKPPSVVAEETPKRFKYHAFIIYSMFDSEWVNTTLIPTLDRYDFKCCVHWKDFLPGKVFTESIVESVHSSYKIIAVVSTNFISSNSCDFELQHAITRLMNNRDDCLIVIKFDEEGVEGLPASILNRSYIDFTQHTDRSTWESKLAEILNKAVIEDDSSGASTISTIDNNSRLSEAGNSTDGSEGRDLICSCQSV